MRIVTFTDQEGRDLLDTLELHQRRNFDNVSEELMAETHRRFVHHVVRWLNDRGWTYTSSKS